MLLRGVNMGTTPVAVVGWPANHPVDCLVTHFFHVSWVSDLVKKLLDILARERAHNEAIVQGTTLFLHVTIVGFPRHKPAKSTMPVQHTSPPASYRWAIVVLLVLPFPTPWPPVILDMGHGTPVVSTVYLWARMMANEQNTTHGAFAHIE